MTSPTSAPRGLEPSTEAVAMLRSQLQQLGFLIRIDSAHEVLRAVLAVEAARLDRHAHDAAAECLRSIQSAAREALDILTQGASPEASKAAAPAPAPLRPSPAPVFTRGASPQRPSPAPLPLSQAPAGEEPVNLAEVVRRRLGEEVPPDSRPPRPETQVAAPPIVVRPVTPINEPRRPVIKHPRKR